MRAIATFVLVALIGIAGCGGGSSGGAVGGRTATPTATPTTTSVPTATPSSSCTLALWLFDYPPRNSSAYFLDVATGVATPAATGLDPTTRFAAYDPVGKRWLPTQPLLVGPGAQRYAYNDTAPGFVQHFRLHVVDVATGADRVISDGPSDHAFEAIAFTSEGIYAHLATEEPWWNAPAGVWLVDPDTGAARQVSSAGREWGAPLHGYAFAVKSNAADPVAQQGGPAADTLYRLSWSTGTSEEWYRERGSTLVLLGLDVAQRPVLAAGSQVFVVTLPGSAQALANPEGATFQVADHRVIPDVGGFWVTADQGVFRYTAAAGLHRIFDRPAQVTGPCF